MANNPKKVKDPTEVALSAIQEALNISDTRRPPQSARLGPRTSAPRRPCSASATPAYDDSFDTRTPSADRQIFEPIEEPRSPRRAANDDRETIGQILQAIQKGRPARNVYTLATLFAGVWILGCALLTVSFLPALQAAIGQSGGTLVLAGLAALFFAPVLLFYFLASLAWRGQEMRMIAQSMAQVAIRFSEPEGAASDSMVTVGQAIRREVAAMGDGVERAIARAGELETLVANEVSALERAYSDNEVRIRALLQDIAHQRDNLVGQAEQVRSAISGVQIDLRHDIALISDAIASRVDEVAKSITGALEERGAHITGALSNAGDNMILALGERGGDLLDRLEEASAETTRAVLDASERLTTSLNFKTGHVHDEFVDLADRVHEMLNERIDRITGEFEQRSSTIVDGISDRTEQVHDSLKNSSDSLLLELELRSGDLVNKIDEAGNRLATQHPHLRRQGQRRARRHRQLAGGQGRQPDRNRARLALAADERVRRTGEEPGRRTGGEIRARQRHARRPDHPPHLGIRPHRQDLRRRNRRSHGSAHPGHRRQPEDLCRQLRHPPDARTAARSPPRWTSAWCSSRPRWAAASPISTPRSTARSKLVRRQDRIDRRRLEVARTELRYAGEVGDRNHRQPPRHAGLVADRRRLAGDQPARLAPYPPHHVADRRHRAGDPFDRLAPRPTSPRR